MAGRLHAIRPLGLLGGRGRAARGADDPVAMLLPHFEARAYARAVGQTFATPVQAARHYLQTGEGRGIWPAPWFDVRWYAGTHAGRLADGESPFLHYLTVGAAAGLSPNAACHLPGGAGLPAPAAAAVAPDTAGVSEAELRRYFAAEWYYAATPELHPFEGDPLAHYLRFGAAEGRWPHPDFDGPWYLDRYWYVRNSGENPLVHYVREGRRSGCRPNAAGGCGFDWPAAEEAPAGRFGPQFRLADMAAMAADTALAEPPAGGDADTVLPDPGPEIRLVSFDVWDTLLRRDCHPDEVKLRTARWLLVRHGGRLAPAFRDLAACYRARLEAERRAAPNNDWEFELPRAMVLWLRDVLLPGSHDAHAVAALAEEACREETRIETAATRADATMAAYLARQGDRPRVFASDFYMRPGPLREILRAAGVPEDRLVAGFSSCETLENKRSGRMYDRIAQAFGVAPGAILHIGDNAEADVAAARARGVRAVHYADEAEARRKDWWRPAMEALLAGEPEPHLARLSAVAGARAQAIRAAGGPGAELRATGAELAPMFLGLGLWMIETAVARQVDRLWFFTREGTFLAEVYRALAARRPYGLTPPAARILAVSRQATFAASLGAVTRAEMMRLWSLYSTQSVRGLARSLTLDEALVEARCAALQIDADAPVADIADSAVAERLFADAAFLDHAEETRRRRRAELAAYLRAEGFAQGRAAHETVVDIGWRGTIQDNLARATGARLSGLYMGLFRFLNPQPDGGAKQGYLFDENEERALILNQEVAPLEMICNAAGGSVTGYAIESDGARPLREVHEAEERSIAAASRPLQEGVLAALPALMDHVERHALRAADLSPLALGVARAALNAPPSCLADAFFALEHNETFGTGAVEDIGGGFGLASLIDGLAEGPASAELHATLDDALARARWREGFVRRGQIAALAAESTPQVRAMPAAFTLPYLDPGPGRRRRMVFVCPAPIRGSGGHRTIYAVARRFVDLGFPVHILLQGEGDGVDVVREMLGGSGGAVHVGWAVGAAGDVAVATTPASAHWIAAQFPDRAQGFYLLQDMEALFNPVGDAFVEAENSLGLGLTPLAVGGWLPHALQTGFGVTAHANGLGHDPGIYRAAPEAARAPAVAALWQPEKPRRAPALAAEALRLLQCRLPEVEIHLYGSDAPAPEGVRATHHGLIGELPRIAALYSRCRAGLCLSFTNPSRIPFEMMACGTVAVDVYRYNNLFDYRAGTAVLAYQDAASIAEALAGLMGPASEWEARSEACRAHAAARTQAWELDTIQNTVLAALAGRPFPAEPSARRYTDPPVIAPGPAAGAAGAFCRHQAALARAGA